MKELIDYYSKKYKWMFKIHPRNGMYTFIGRMNTITYFEKKKKAYLNYRYQRQIILENDYELIELLERYL